MERILEHRRYGWLPLLFWGVVVGVSLATSWRTLHEHALENAASRGRAIFDTIVAVRQWNAGHGGVYVPVSASSPPNPYLRVPHREIQAPEGKTLTRINPAYMTRQISAIMEHGGALRMHITSLKPLNPDNAPTPWEREALQGFEQGSTESSLLESGHDDARFHYMAPLITQQTCLACHGHQGYQVGEVRGGISISFPAKAVFAPFADQRGQLAIRHAIAWLLLSGMSVYFLHRFQGQMLALRQARDQQEELVESRTSELRDEVRQRRQLEERFRSLAQSAVDAIVATDSRGRVIFWNQGASHIFGYEEGEILGHPLKTLLAGESRTVFASESITRGLAPLGHTVEWLGVDKMGRRIPLDVSLSGWTSGEENYLSAVMRDISERKALENDLRQAKETAEQASRIKGEFLATMSHEIRTPLNAIIGAGELLLDSPLNAEQRNHVALAQRAGAALLTLIDDILDLSRVEAGVFRLERITFNLAELVASALDVVAVRGRDKGLRLRQRMEPGLPTWVSGDPARLRQVLLNLIGNAIKFTLDGEVEVTADATASRDAIRFAVRDTGIGIAPEHLTTIFDPFTQADASTTRRFGGTGLGLAISQRLIHQMGGDIQVESELGQGSLFSFTLHLPAMNSPREEVDPAPSHPPLLPTRALNILLAEDSDDNRLLVQAYLKNTPHHLIAVADGAAAVEHFRAQLFDLVLMDLQMPLMDGFTATRAIRDWEHAQGLTATPIVALTAYAMREDVDKSLAAGCTLHISKPVKKSRLLEVIVQLTA